MPPIALNRRRFLGCSAAAGLALSQGKGVDGSELSPIRLGVIGLGTRGTTLVRTALEIPGTQVVALADSEPKHRLRAQGIVEKAAGQRPEAYEAAAKLLERDDLDAVAIALPCDLHAAAYIQAIRAGKHLYAEKPLAPSLADCDRIIQEAAGSPDVIVHVGYQRRSNPRYQGAVAAIAKGELGDPVAALASWTSSNGPVNGHGDWLAHRERSGDWMVEQAVHVWDVFHWLLGSSPVNATGQGRRGLFSRTQPTRDVTDDYSVQLFWNSGFHLSFHQSWIVPADDAFTGIQQRLWGTEGGLDLSTGTITYRDRSRPRRSIHPGAQPDTRLALEAFFSAIRSSEPPAPPISLEEAREATRIGLLARKAVDDSGHGTDNRSASVNLS